MERDLKFRSSKFSNASNISEKIINSNKNRMSSFEEFKNSLISKHIEIKTKKVQTSYIIQKPFANNPNKTSYSLLSKNSSMPNLNFTRTQFHENSSFTGSNILKFDEKREKDIPILLSHYHSRLNLIEKDYKKKQEKEQYFNKYNIDPRLSLKEEKEITKIIEGDSVRNSIKKPNSYTQFEFFKNPYSSYKDLKMNKMIINRVSEILKEIQIKKYIGEYELALKFKKREKDNKRIKIEASDLTKKKDKNIKDLLTPINNFHDNINQEFENEEVEVKFDSVEFHGSIMNYQSNKPPARTLFTMTLDDKKLYIFGGISKEKFSDLWCIDLIDAKRWNYIEAKGSIPSPRFGHTTVLFKHQLIIFGGKITNEENILREVIFYDITSNIYFPGNIANTSSIKWRKNHIAEVVFPYMVIHGGIDDDGNVLNDICFLDLVNLKWQKYEIKNTDIPFLAFHSSSFVIKSELKKLAGFSIFRTPESNSKILGTPIKYEGIYIFGGLDNNKKFSNELRIIKTGKKLLEWIIPKTEGSPPCPRISSTLTFFEDLNVLVIFGGRNENELCLNDIFLISLVNLKWTKIIVYDYLPRNRAEHCAICFKNSKLLVLGGINSQKYLGSDIYVIDFEKYERKKKHSNYEEYRLKDEETKVELNGNEIPSNNTQNKVRSSIIRSKTLVFQNNLDKLIDT